MKFKQLNLRSISDWLKITRSSGKTCFHCFSVVESSNSVARWYGCRSSIDGRREQPVLSGLIQLRLSRAHTPPPMKTPPAIWLNQEVPMWMRKAGRDSRHVMVLCIYDKYLLTNLLTMRHVGIGGVQTGREKVSQSTTQKDKTWQTEGRGGVGETMFTGNSEWVWEHELTGKTAGSRGRAAEKSLLKSTTEWEMGLRQGRWVGEKNHTHTHWKLSTVSM